MPHDSVEPAVEKRLVDLELKLSYLEDLTDQLNGVVVRQQDQIDGLLRIVQALRRQLDSQEPGGLRSLRDELPPHY